MATRNGDAHLKNFGVVYDRSARVSLAPAYDLVTTTVYVSKDLPALELAGRRAWPGRDALEAFGSRACNLRRRSIERSFDAVRSGIERATRELRRFGRAHPEHRRLCEAMRNQWTSGLRSLET
jgi:serine/threonine-protein kinase HipA